MRGLPGGGWRLIPSFVLHPLATFREVLRIEFDLVAPALAMLAGFSSFNEGLVDSTWWHQRLPPPFVWCFALVLGSYVGLFWLFVTGWLVSGIGRRLGGSGDAADVRRALGWASAPIVLWLLVSLLRIRALGSMSHGVAPWIAVGTETHDSADAVMKVASLGAHGAQIALAVLLVAAAHGVSRKRAAATLVISTLAQSAMVVGAVIAFGAAL